MSDETRSSSPGRPAPADPGRIRFREAVPPDAAAMLALKHALDRETSFMLLEAGERTESAADLAADLGRVAAAANSVVIVAETPRGLAGYVAADGGRFRRSRLTAHVVIGVLAADAGRGVGSGLLRALESWARARGLHRLELTVMAHNRRAIRLYQRMSFGVEGRRRECLLVNGEFVDELHMARLLR